VRTGLVGNLARPGGNVTGILRTSRAAELALKVRLPAASVPCWFGEEGGLISYSPKQADLYRQAATYVDKSSRVRGRPKCRSSSLDPATGALMRTFEGHSDALALSVAFSPDGKQSLGLAASADNFRMHRTIRQGEA